MTKKVFSKEKYKEWQKSRENKDKEWWEKCDGLTEKEMAKLGFTTYDSWMVEVEDNDN